MKYFKKAPIKKGQKVFVRFGISSKSLTAKQIKAKIGFSFDESWKKGDSRVNKLPYLINKDHGVWVNSTLSTTASLEAHIQNLLKRLNKFTPRIAKCLNGECEGSFECIVYTASQDSPILYFNRSVVKAVAALGAEFGIDYYALPKNWIPKTKKQFDRDLGRWLEWYNDGK